MQPREQADLPNLSDEIWLKIFSNLDGGSLNQAALVNNSWYRLARDKKLWNHAGNKHWHWIYRVMFGNPNQLSELEVQALKSEINNKEDATEDTHGNSLAFKLVLTAAKLGKKDWMTFLLGCGADINVYNLVHETPLHYAVYNIRKENSAKDMVNFLLDHGADINKKNGASKTPLHLAVKVRRIGLIEYLLERKANPNAPDNHGHTPLHELAMLGDFKKDDDRNIKALKLLLAHGADVNKINGYGSTPLHYAVRLHSTPFIKLLLDKGADVTKKCKHFGSPIDIAIERKKQDQSENNDIINLILAKMSQEELNQLLSQATEGVIEGADVDLVKQLIEHHADINALDSQGQTPLHHAVRVGNVKLIELLLNCGANINLQNCPAKVNLQHAGETALHYALRARKDVVNLLLAKADKRELDTLLHQAVESEDRALLKLLLEHNADINALNSKGQTALHLAARSLPLHSIVKQLLESNAKVNVRDRENKTPLRILKEQPGPVNPELISLAGKAKYQEKAAAYQAQVSKRDDTHYKNTLALFGFTIWRFGYSAGEKRKAVDALLQVMTHKANESTLREHEGALNNGELGKIYRKYRKYGR